MKHPKEKPGVDNKQLLEFQTFLDPRRRGFMTREWNYSLISYLTSPRLDGPQRPDSHSCNRKKKDKEKAKVLKHELPFSFPRLFNDLLFKEVCNLISIVSHP